MKTVMCTLFVSSTAARVISTTIKLTNLSVLALKVRGQGQMCPVLFDLEK